MPKKRPEGDGLAIWLIAEVLRDGRRGMLESAFIAISNSLKPLPSNKRGQSAYIDTETGIVVGDKLGIERIRAFYKDVGKHRAVDRGFKSETSRRLAQLKSDVAAKPRSWLLPFRNKASDSKVCEWMIAQYWPGAPLEERLTMHAANPPPPGYAIKLAWADEPGGPIEVEWPELS